MRSPLKLRLLGRFEARLGSGPPLVFATRKSQALLACLALRMGHSQPRDSLIALLWGDADPPRARQNLRQALTEVRRLLRGNPGLVSDRETVALRGNGVESDVMAFDRLLSERTPDALEQALNLYRGELLEGFSLDEEAYEDWLGTARERMRMRAVQGLAELLVQQVNTEQDEKAISTATRLVDLEPYHEPAHRALMRLHQRQGRRGLALRQYQLCVRVLQQELGTEPEEETRLLYQDIVACPPAPGSGMSAAHAAAGGTAQMLVSHDAPLIGRDVEIEALGDALRSAWRDKGGTALLLGEAGIGKSRLAEELAALASTNGGRVLTGRSFELERLLPFRPWADALRSGGITADSAELADFNPVWRTELSRILPEWSAAWVQADSVSEDRLRVYDAFAQLLVHLARQRPLLVLLEDLHWADEPSLRLLAFVHRRIASHCVLLLATARNDEPESASVLRRAQRELASDARAQCRTLAPLSRSALESLVRRLLRGGHAAPEIDERVERIWSMSEGNPFVALEAVRAMGHDAATPASGALDLPRRVREMIAARLELLEMDALALASTAAVIGREFDFDLLQRSAGFDAGAAASALEKLVRRRVLHPVGEGFAFTHERIREVAYAQLLQPRRRLLHERVALTMETLYADDPSPHLAALGSHFAEAGAWEKAVAYLRRAGHQAHQRSANREAAVSFQRALHALGRLPHNRASNALSIDLRLDLQSSLVLLGELPHIVEHLRQARADAEALGDRSRLGRVLVHATHCAWWLGDCDAALESGTVAEAIASGGEDVSLQVMANYRLGQVHLSRGDYLRARELFGRALALLPQDRLNERFGMPSLPGVVSRTFLAWTLVSLGEFEAARRTAEEGMRVAEAAGHPYSTTIACRGVALAPLACGDYLLAVSPLEKALEICRRRELPFMTPWITGDLGRAYALGGRYDEAVALLEQSLNESESLRMMMIHPRDVAALAEVQMLAGRRADARGSIDRALRLARAHKQRGVEAEALKVLGDIASHDANGRQLAASAYRDSLTLAESLGQAPLAAECHMSIGAWYAVGGAAELAREHMNEAATRYRNLGMTRRLEQVRTALGSVA